MSKRYLVIAAGVALALTPAVAGAVGNTSLSHRVPVSGPTPITVDDKGGLRDRDLRVEPGDDRGGASGADDSPSSLPSSSASPSATPSVGPSAHDAGDDKGGLRDRDQRVEPGDDRDAGTPGTDDSGADDSGSGSGSSGSDDSGPDDSGRGSDDSGQDDSGHHGSDDATAPGTDDSGHHGSDD